MVPPSPCPDDLQQSPLGWHGIQAQHSEWKALNLNRYSRCRNPSKDRNVEPCKYWPQVIIAPKIWAPQTWNRTVECGVNQWRWRWCTGFAWRALTIRKVWLGPKTGWSHLTRDLGDLILALRKSCFSLCKLSFCRGKLWSVFQSCAQSSCSLQITCLANKCKMSPKKVCNAEIVCKWVVFAVVFG
jgi:hypothetical protein